MSVFAWGLGKSGQLGNGSCENQVLPTQVCDGRLKSTPKSKARAKHSEPIEAVAVCCGALFTAFVTKDGKVLSFGCGKHGRLGFDDDEDHVRPTVVEALADEHVMEVTEFKVGK